MNEQSINANVAQCISQKAHWGYDTYVNYCIGKSYNVDWVPMDYGVAFFGIVAITILILILIHIIAD